MIALEQALKAFVDSRIDARLEQLGIKPNASAFYMTSAPSTWPPGCRTRRAARDRIRAVPGHTREGTGRATIWSCAKTAYEKHCAKRPSLAVVVPIDSDEELISGALTRAGLRSTRSAA